MNTTDRSLPPQTSHKPFGTLLGGMIALALIELTGITALIPAEEIRAAADGVGAILGAALGAWITPNKRKDVSP